MGSTTYDYVVVGGGLAGVVVASRLRQYNGAAKVLILEAGPDTRSRTDIQNMQALNLGGELDWMCQTEQIPGLLGRSLVINQGKGLGGGSAINSGGWTRGAAVDYDEWAAVVGDDRWSYKGQLPWMKKSEHWFDNESPDQHGSDGPIHVASAGSAGRTFPLSEPMGSAWDELGVPKLPNWEQNSGDNIGRAHLCEGRRDGKRQWSASVYPLEGVEVKSNSLVKKVVLDNSSGTPKAVGVELADGTVISSNEVIISAGAFRSPQLLMLSGIGPAAHLEKVGVKTQVDLPEVGQGLSDHMSFFQYWKLRDSSPGYTIGSANPIFQDPKYASGVPMDWIVCTSVPKEGLKEAIKKDEGVEPSPSHRLLAKDRTFLENVVLNMKLPFPGIPMDADHLTTDVVSFLPTSTGSVELRSTNPEDTPKINMNYLSTEVDKYVYREGLRQLTRFMLGTKFGKEYIAGESVPEGLEPLALDDDDAKLDKRLALTGMTTWHVNGTCAMGKVVDTQLRVKGVEGLRVVDSSVLPVPLSAHIQAPTYALAEQAAAIIAGKA